MTTGPKSPKSKHTTDTTREETPSSDKTVYVEVRTAKKPAAEQGVSHANKFDSELPRPDYRIPAAIGGFGVLLIALVAWVILGHPSGNAPAPVAELAGEPRQEKPAPGSRDDNKPGTLPAELEEAVTHLGAREPAAIHAGPGSEWEPKVHEVLALTHGLELEGYDVSPVAELMKKAAEEQDKNPGSPDGARNLDQALSISRTKQGLIKKRPPGTPQELEARLRGKVNEVQRLVFQSGNAALAGEVDQRMKRFGSLMEAGEVLQAEKLLDETLELARSKD
jgi:hypothetical protein